LYLIGFAIVGVIKNKTKIISVIKKVPFPGPEEKEVILNQ
jgi:hypothetical protein